MSLGSGDVEDYGSPGKLSSLRTQVGLFITIRTAANGDFEISESLLPNSGTADRVSRR